MTSKQPHNMPRNQPTENHNKVPTPINVARFIHLLEGYDKHKIDYLAEGLYNGFRLDLDQDSQIMSPDPFNS